MLKPTGASLNVTLGLFKSLVGLETAIKEATPRASKAKPAAANGKQGAKKGGRGRGRPKGKGKSKQGKEKEVDGPEENDENEDQEGNEPAGDKSKGA
jgi:hypothetical protein